MKQVVIVGAGISGLSLAYFLEKKYREKIAVTIIEKERRVGGWLRTLEYEGVPFELGPRALRMSPDTLELAKELGLPLRHSKVKERYFAHNGRLEKLNVRYLWRHRCLWPMIRRHLYKREEQKDESIASFFRRTASSEVVEHLIAPLCKGIFAQDPEDLSLQACWKKRTKTATLSSFVGGIEALPRALSKQIKGTVLIGEEVLSFHPHNKGVTIQLQDRTLEADLLFLSAPTLYEPPSFSQKTVSLITVNCFFSSKHIFPKGFGFLSKDPGPLLGISFDSNIFPAKLSHLCAMIQGEHSDEEAQKITLHALSTYLQLSLTPEKMFVSRAKDAIYQYPVGHLEKIQEIENSLPSSIILNSARYYGISVNECIARSKKTCLQL